MGRERQRRDWRKGTEKGKRGRNSNTVRQSNARRRGLQTGRHPQTGRGGVVRKVSGAAERGGRVKQRVRERDLASKLVRFWEQQVQRTVSEEKVPVKNERPKH